MLKETDLSNQEIKTQISEKTIAVLPFVNMSGNKDFEYFSDGITEEIINALARIDSLKVTSRTSSFIFKNLKKSIGEIASELSVGVILEGSVRLAKDTVRITAQLIQAENDFHFWSETWDRKLENIFEVQDEISLLIADKLRELYGHFEIQDHLVLSKTKSITAYEYSLKARYHFNKWNPDDVKKAIELLEKAIWLDPDYADAYVDLADAMGFLAVTEIMPAAKVWPKVKEYIQKANTLDPNNAGVYYQLANLAFFTEADFKSALKYSLKTLEIKPNYVEAQQFTSFLYVISGDFKKGKMHLDLAMEINPLSQETLFYKAYYLYRQDDQENALELFNNILKINPNNIPAIVQKCYCLINLGKAEKALSYIDNIPGNIIPGDEYLGLSSIANLSLDKNKTETEKYYSELRKAAQNNTSFQAHSYLYLFYAISNRHEEAFEWLDKIIKLNSPILLLSFADPMTGSVKNHPRYSDYQKMLFPQPDAAEESKSSKPALLDKETAEKYTETIFTYINEEEPFLVPNISLRSLAEQLEIHPNKLSWLLNEKMGKNFNEFINHYRIEYFKKLVKDPDNANISLLGLAYESGFNSKTVFNTYFKKETGMTPKEYMNTEH